MKAKFALIGESDFEELHNNLEQMHAKTLCGTTSPLVTAKICDKILAFLPKHGPRHPILPHEINCKTDVWALREFSVELAEISNRIFSETEQLLIEADRTLSIRRIDKCDPSRVFDSARFD